MKTLVNYNLYLLTLALYVSWVSMYRIYSRALGGVTDWHTIMFQRPDFPLFDWWRYLIPCFIASYILLRFVPLNLRKVILGFILIVTVFLIIASYF